MNRAARRERRHALAGTGPIVDRARRALAAVAAQFGEVTESTQTAVSVRTSGGIPLTLSYDPGNYLFSRVYNLTIAVELPAEGTVPAGLSLSHRDRGGSRLVAANGGSPGLDALNATLRAHLDGIDLVSLRTERTGDGVTATLTPMGGSFVWVLIPPIFKATAFPSGEPERILGLIRALRSQTPASAAPKR